MPELPYAAMLRLRYAIITPLMLRHMHTLFHADTIITPGAAAAMPLPSRYASLMPLKRCFCRLPLLCAMLFCEMPL